MYFDFNLNDDSCCWYLIVVVRNELVLIEEL